VPDQTAKSDGSTTAWQPGRRFSEALGFAVDTHSKQRRKGSETPYIAHLLSVAALVIEDGGTEDEAIAALLHDAAEDHGGVGMLTEIGELFNDHVRSIVEACSDSLVPEGEEKEDWRPRKERYLAHLAEADDSALRVSNADKLHNARAILADYKRIGDRLWERFSTKSGADQLWYYGELASIFRQRRPSSELPAMLHHTVQELKALVVVRAQPGSREAWLSRAISETDDYATSIFEDFETERVAARFASEDYDWLLTERDTALYAEETQRRLEQELRDRQAAFESHGKKW